MSYLLSSPLGKTLAKFKCLINVSINLKSDGTDAISIEP